MTTNRYSSAREQIIQAYEIVRQVGGTETIVQRVAKFLGRKLDYHGDHSHIRRTIRSYQIHKQNPS